MRIKFHHVLAFFIVTLLLDLSLGGASTASTGGAGGGAKLRPMDAFLVIVLLLMFLSQKNFKIITHPVAVLFYIYITYSIINGFTKVPYVTVIKEGVQLIEYIFLMHLIANGTDNSVKRKQFLNIIFWGAGAVAVYIVVYHVSNGVYSGYKDLDAPKHSFAIFALLAIITYISAKRNKKFYLFIIMVALLMSLLSGERKGWAGLFVGISAFLWLQLRSTPTKRNVKTIGTFILIIILLGVGAILIFAGNAQFHYLDKQFGSFADIWARLSGAPGTLSAADSRSDQERAFMFDFGIALFLKNPYTGIGIEQFASYIIKASHGVYTHDAHNFYLKILDEEGLIGFVLFLVFNFFMLYNILKKTMLKSMPDIAFTARVLIALFFLGSVVNFFLASKAITWVYFLMPCGMFIGMLREIKARAEKEEEAGEKNELEDEEQVSDDDKVPEIGFVT